MFNRMKLPISLVGFTALAIVGAVALSAPASAAKISAVLGACKRSAGCESWSDGKGWAIGCGRYGCFECNNGKCHSVARSAVETKRNGAGIRASVDNVSSPTRPTLNKPTTISNPGTVKMRMGGRH
jgi:hypothetical protein